MKKKYTQPSIEALEYAQFENVFTYCDRNPARVGCINVTGSGNDEDKPIGLPQSETTSHKNLPFEGGGEDDLS